MNPRNDNQSNENALFPDVDHGRENEQITTEIWGNFGVIC
jgi:hypothetical protein